MAAFQAALANFNNQQQNAPSASSSSSTGATVSIRGSANGAPNTRAAAMALRGAGITREQGMDVDGSSRGGGGRGRGAGRRTGGRSAGPLDQRTQRGSQRSFETGAAFVATRSSRKPRLSTLFRLPLRILLVYLLPV
ncbi:hypothetical protein I317_01474 [Kwoniella heveanensis CBS 569]|nr:hypothetical protein I317_01474 [Kwoniella heveanensis CBS 569]